MTAASNWRASGVLALVIVVATHVTTQENLAKQQLLPTGKLRVGINAGNELTRAVGSDIAQEIARRLGAELVFVEYATPGAVVDNAGKEWDIAFVAADPAREHLVAFTPPYAELDVTYLVREDSPIRAVADADRRGVTVSAAPTTAYALFLQRELRNATLATLSNVDGPKALAAGTVDAVAGLRFQLLQRAAQTPRTRVLPDNLTRAQQGIAVPKSNDAALAYLTALVRELTRSGFMAAAIQKTGFPGASVAIPR